MDFTVELSLTARRHDPIVVTVDTLTKSSHFVPVRMMHQAPGIARVISTRFETARRTKGIISDKGFSVCKMILDEFPKRPWEHH
jgi:predicted nucleotide-binding protein